MIRASSVKHKSAEVMYLQYRSFAKYTALLSEGQMLMQTDNPEDKKRRAPNIETCFENTYETWLEACSFGLTTLKMNITHAVWGAMQPGADARRWLLSC